MKIRFAAPLESRLRGLVGFEGEREEEALVVGFCRGVRTYGTHSPLDLAFIDSHGVVVRSCRGVPPGEKVFCREAVAVIERAIPLVWDAQENPWFEVGQRLELAVCLESEACDENMPALRSYWI